MKNALFLRRKYMNECPKPHHEKVQFISKYYKQMSKGNTDIICICYLLFVFVLAFLKFVCFTQAVCRIYFLGIKVVCIKSFILISTNHNVCEGFFNSKKAS